MDEADTNTTIEPMTVLTGAARGLLQDGAVWAGALVFVQAARRTVREFSFEVEVDVTGAPDKAGETS